MKRVRKADGTIHHIAEKHLQTVLQDGDAVLEDETVSPTVPTEEEIAAMNREQLRRDAKKYLADTDWYVSRKSETGKAIPDDILTKRAQARIEASE